MELESVREWATDILALNIISLQMTHVARVRTLIAKACGVLFSVAGGQ